ncbi:unnamed protein product [Phytophthora fragariaefolia]|uniref:Unnamed protein product n=1 Tax=Phytophthora fragariaefolia TaxID=1490495 RepID=A0A9W6U660_9STRA|nr:unnamed protein product [Phytophthora fragariaefolia]
MRHRGEITVQVARADAMDAHQSPRGVAAAHWEEGDASIHAPVRAARRSGVVPVTKPAPNEHTKLLGGEDAELEKETKHYFHTKHVGLMALFGTQNGKGVHREIYATRSNAACCCLQSLSGQTSSRLKLCNTSRYLVQPPAQVTFTLRVFFCDPADGYRLQETFLRHVLQPCCTGKSTWHTQCQQLFIREYRHAAFNIVTVLQRHSVVPLRKLLRLSAFLGVFYLVADYFWFASFQNLTVAAGAAIFNSSPLFVYCFSICLLHEKVSVKKLFGVLLAFGGVIMVVLYQGGDDARGIGNPSVVGGLMMVTSAILNAGYGVSVALTAGAEINDTSTLMIMMGMSGMFTIPVWLVGTIFFAHSPFSSLYEPIGFPPTAEGNLMLTIAIVMFATNFVFLTFAVCWTSPLETSVGFMLTIPLSGVMDTLMHSTSFTWQCIAGSTLVMAGFLILELSSTNPPHHHDSHEESADKTHLV